LRSAEIIDGKLWLVLNNTLSAIQDGQSELSQFLAGWALDPRICHRLEALFEELVANTIRHGFAKGSGQSIHVLVEQKSGAVQLTFEDDGVPFNPLEANPPEPFSSLEEAKIGGLGVSLVAKLSSDLRYERLEPDHSGPGGFMPCNRVLVSVAA
jgi:anti-sigma regulatory factor (Ser/Thr protein kinase)